MSARTVVCRYYTRGICRFGDMCRFLHPDDLIIDSNQTEHNTDDNNETPTITSIKDEIDTQQNWAMAPIFIPKSQNLNNLHDDDELTTNYNTSSASTSTANSDTNLCTNNNNNNNNNSNTKPISTDTINSFKSYAEIAGGGVNNKNKNTAGCSGQIDHEICPFEMGCPYGLYCAYDQHGDLCDMCGRYCLHPTDKEQRRKHNQECLQQHEKDMELSFAVARSQNKTCGICFDTIIEKVGREKRFGILPNCYHIFCLECIRKWRQAKQFENKITRSCPECRTSSDFVCPSAFWVDTQDEKDKLITEYKSALGDKDCKYFNKGKGKCPFGNKCFYKHALPNGVIVDVGIPQKHRKITSNLGIMELFSDISLYEFIGNRGLPLSWFEFLSNLQESDESDWSEEFE